MLNVSNKTKNVFGEFLNTLATSAAANRNKIRVLMS